MNLDCVVIGAGVVGLAVARELTKSGFKVYILEKNHSFGMETSSRNSEVIHAGIYYPKDSLKALHCVKGKQLLYDFCLSRLIPHQRIGKIIVATDETEILELTNYYQNAAINGVKDLVWLEEPDLKKLEPELKGVAGILSPSSGIIDSHTFMQTLLTDIEGLQGVLVKKTKVLSGESTKGGIKLLIDDGEKNLLTSKWVVNCAGLHATEVAKKIKGISIQSIPNPAFAIGHYYALAGKPPFSRLIYPVKEPGGLGIHFTKDLSGSTRLGPDFRWVDKIDYRFKDNERLKFLKSVQRYYPKISKTDLIPDQTGIRIKIGGKDNPSVDFKIQIKSEHLVPGLINLFGIESPGLTASLSIAKEVSKIMQENLDCR